jgi:hypothetical protein
MIDRHKRSFVEIARKFAKFALELKKDFEHFI